MGLELEKPNLLEDTLNLEPSIKASDDVTIDVIQLVFVC